MFTPPYSSNGKYSRNRKRWLSESEIMTILVYCYFGIFRNFKEYCQNCIRRWLRHEFPVAVSYNRFVEFVPRMFFNMMISMKLYAFSGCTGITFVDNMMIPVCHNVRRYFNKVFAGLARSGKVLWGGVMASSFIFFVMI